MSGSSNDKPTARSLGWRMHESGTAFQNDIFGVRDDSIEVGGQHRRYAYVERAAAVIIVQVTPAGEIVMLRQYRYPVDEWCIEVPAGGMHDTGDASVVEVARKELCEDVGASVGEITEVATFYTTSSLMDERCHVVLAENVELTSEPDPETTEEIRVRLMKAVDVVELARSGGMATGPCALGVLMCEPLLRARGYLG